MHPPEHMVRALPGVPRTRHQGRVEQFFLPCPCTSFQLGGLDAGDILHDCHRCRALLFTVENLEVLPRIEPAVIGGYLEEEEKQDTE